MQVELPDGLLGVIKIENVSAKFASHLRTDGLLLDRFYRPGQLLPAKVINCIHSFNNKGTLYFQIALILKFC